MFFQWHKIEGHSNRPHRKYLEKSVESLTEQKRLSSGNAFPAKNPDFDIAKRLQSERRRKVLVAVVALILLLSAVLILAVWVITGTEWLSPG